MRVLLDECVPQRLRHHLVGHEVHVKLATALGISQAAVSKLERQSDMSIRTLRRYVEAAGGALEIVAKLPSGKLRLDHLGK